MFIYFAFLMIVMVLLAGSGGYLIYTARQPRIRSNRDEKLLDSPDSVVDDLISELIAVNKSIELVQKKDEIIDTFIKLHRDGAICKNMTPAEVICYVKHKLSIEEN